jgi:hypothetical protein
MSAQTILRCRCGAVECRGHGKPISTAVCYCDDCQAAARQIEALSGAPPAADPDGGFAAVVFHRKRFETTLGADLLDRYRLRSESPTYRMVARCCNSAMYLGFDKGFWWISAYRNRVVGKPPPIEFRHMIRYRTSELPLPKDAPHSQGYPPRLVLRSAGVGLAAKLGLY